MELEKEFTFRNTSLPQRCYNAFVDMRNRKKFLDIEMNIGTQRISAHRAILAAAIPLFRETLSNDDEISVPNIDPAVFELLVDYAYSCELKITMDNVKDLLSASCILQMNDVQDACCDFLSERLQAQYVLTYRNLANDLNLPKLKEYVDHYVKENFEEVSGTEEFLNCPFEYVRELIAKDDLNVESEEKVLDSVLRWVKASVDERTSKFPELLAQVRMVLFNLLYLTELVEREELIRMSLTCRDLVDEAKNYSLFEERRKCCRFVTKPRDFLNISEGNEETSTKLYCLEAKLKYSVRQFELNDPLCQTPPKDQWKTKGTTEYLINTGSITKSNRKMYFFHEACLLEYDPEGDKYELRFRFPLVRSFTAAVSLGNKFFICGGVTGKYVASNTVECYDPEKNEVQQVGNLQTARWSLNAVSLGNYIYTLGGRDKHNSYDTVERYSFILNKWQYVSPMLTRRYNAGATVLNGKIYVCGGILGNKCTETAEMYDPLTNKWKFISSVNTARAELTLLVFSGKLYAIGGYDKDGKDLKSCEVYDLQSNKWEYDHTFDCSFDVSGFIVL